ncbi:MAG: NAD(P)-dependent oxidoreductase [Trueperaceae bacterium]
MSQHEISLDRLQDAFSETYPRYTENEAVVEANRCLYCFDAPCIAACPTGIDVPTFIRKIATGNVLGAATTILESNLMGHSCGRVCPVDELCVGACVLGAEYRPIAIGRLQRYATDHLFERGAMPFTPAPATGKKVAVVGGGPAGLSCAGELAKRGIAATVFEKQELPGGLSTYGIVVLREPVKVSLEEVAFVERLGVEVRAGVEVGANVGADVGADVSPQRLLDEYDAVVIAVGTGPVPKLGIPGEDAEGVIDALPFIAATKLADKDGLERLRDIPVGNEVVVVGAGNTAIDAATVAKRLGAERVTMVYRRGREQMTAYDFEVAFVQNEGVDIRLLTQPVEVLTEAGRATGLRSVRMALGEPGPDGRRRPEPVPGSEFVLPCDQVIKAIGQEKLVPLFEAFGVETLHGYVRTDAALRTSNPNVFAAGDCIRLTGHALTVTAAQDGKIAAAAIAAQLGVPAPAPERVTGRAIHGTRHAGSGPAGATPGSVAHG